MSTYSTRRRSSRIQRNGSPNRNSTIINGTGSFSHNNTNSNRSLSINNNNNTNRNGHKYSGRKRRKPESDNESSHNDSDYENNDNSNHNNKRRRLNNTYSQQSELATQTQTTQTRNRRKISYKLQKGKWNVSPTNKLNIKRRSTRIKYRQLADSTIENRAAIVDPMNKDFINKLVTQNNIYNNVIHPNEAYMDIEQAKTMTTILKEQTHTLANEHFTITPNDYIKAIYKEFTIDNNNNNNSDNDDDDDDEPKRINWSAVGQRFAPWFLTVPSIQFMNGPLQQSILSQPEEKKKRQTRKKQTFTSDAPVIQPKKVVKQKKSDKTETKSRVQHLRKVLKKKCNVQDGVNPFEFLINPKSYSQTIENLFDLSFIMKEGDAQMNVDNNTKQPVLSYISKAENTRRLNINKQNNKQKRVNKKNKKNNNGQCIVKFNPHDYYSLINAYQIAESQIERADANQSSDEDNDDDSEVPEEPLDSDSDNEENDGNNDRAMNGHNGRNGRKRYNKDKEEAE